MSNMADTLHVVIGSTLTPRHGLNIFNFHEMGRLPNMKCFHIRTTRRAQVLAF